MSMREKLVRGHGRPQIYDQSWISEVNVFGDATEVTDAPDEWVTGGDDEIDTTDQKNAARDVMHLLAELTDPDDPTQPAPNDATATIGLWVQPSDDNGWYMVDEFSMDNDIGQIWTLRHNLPGTYRVSVEDISADTRVEVKYSVTG